MPLVQTLAIPQNGRGHDHLCPRSPEVGNVTGQCFIKRKAEEPSAAARDDAAAKTLWEASAALAGSWP